jgi:serine/threonine protein kinase
MSAEPQRTCPSCGNELSGAMEFCPVCMLRKGLAGGVASGESSASENTIKPTAEQAAQRFEHYELVTGEDGKPVELGRGAMGVTYKAFDVDLHCPVTLKVISERYVADESARLRFLREARAAASVRHPNVASVFHLGRTGSSYFYAMEFVEGETLEDLIRRFGRLEAKSALEITTQVAAGLAAVHEQNLVHRDIKPSNIMVRLKDDGGITAKIIDLGLAKAIIEPSLQTAISTPGGFVGTPDFASPEQFAGLALDTRSDLYSLGVTLWEMLTGRTPFRGTPAEVMHQHQRAPLPLDQVEGVPQPVVVLLQVLLEKDPTRRFQSPAELLKAMPTIKGAIEASRTIKQQKLRTTFVDKASARQKKSSAVRAPKRSIAVLPFDTLSQGQRNTYFADGVQDEILSNLAKVSQLKVISRTSVMTYRPRNSRDLRSIANALGVANVVEGTVRRDGNRIRITVRLVDARTDEALWSESYDRELTNIFAIQSDIAQTVAAKLSARLSPKERKDIDEEPTKSLEAYDLYLQGKESIFDAEYYSEDEREKILNAIGFLEAAIRKDSKFALAYCLLAKAHDDLYGWGYDTTNNRRALGDAAVNEALRLGRDLPETHLANAFHLYVCYRNHERARVQIGIAQQILPNSPTAFYLAAIIDRRQGRWETSTAALERACNLDPRNSKFLTGLGRNYKDLHRYRDAEKIYDRLIEFEPNRLLHKKNKASVAFLRTGDVQSYRSVLEALPSSLKDIPDLVSERFDLALCARDWGGHKTDPQREHKRRTTPSGCCRSSSMR